MGLYINGWFVATGDPEGNDAEGKSGSTYAHFINKNKFSFAYGANHYDSCFNIATAGGIHFVNVNNTHGHHQNIYTVSVRSIGVARNFHT